MSIVNLPTIHNINILILSETPTEISLCISLQFTYVVALFTLSLVLHSLVQSLFVYTIDIVLRLLLFIKLLKYIIIFYHNKLH